jgi:DNA invertase Pin-like site-specific DNA recombinase
MRVVAHSVPWQKSGHIPLDSSPKGSNDVHDPSKLSQRKEQFHEENPPIDPLPATAPKRKRVAAYARVSSGKDAMLQSLSGQISYYSKFIQQHVEWEFAGVYADEAVTGTKDNRKEFQRLLTDCRAGKIDMVITKSITRFARNTLTTLQTVRELKNIGVDVYFEKENIHSDSGDGELMLSILASYAQEESRSVSENCKWRIRKGFVEGKPFGLHTMLGYRIKYGEFQIIPEEAEIVRAIFASYISGMGIEALMKSLKEQGIHLGKSTIKEILRNITYTGDLLLQRTFIADHLTKQQKANKGELPMYHIEGHHAPIIERAVFDAVQAEIARRMAKYASPLSANTKTYPFSGRICCGICGASYRRKIAMAGTKYAKPIWICQTFNIYGKSACPSQQIPEAVLERLVAERGSMEKITKIQVPKAQHVTFVYTDGCEEIVEWHTTRKDSWTEEMKQTARERQLQVLKERKEQPPCQK